MKGNNGGLDDEEILESVYTILVLVVTPTVSALGIVGNCFGVAVLFKQGLRKSSNIFLIVLAVADMIYLVSFNGERLILYHLIDLEAFRFLSDQTCSDFMVLFCIFFYFDYSTATVSYTLPTLITIERLIAVFAPLSFHRIVTVRRTWIIVLLMCLTWFAFLIYPSFFLELRVANGSINKSSAFIEHKFVTVSGPALEVLEHFLLYCAMTISPIFTAFGCLIISLKLKFENVKRKRMTTREKSSNRTTLMLLSVCVVYIVTCIIQSLHIYLPNEIVSTVFTDRSPSNLSKILHQSANIASCINCSSNFVVYICTNKQFRNVYVEIFCRFRKKRVW
ncbi:unnamed protein product [Candidula unifasciata]|uniref:G-protein coupled receptors family 1 profile domain-containing protein n=1 Tax=Candidula unifasciata TaxID=100452 RepID=A0A8S3ZLB5_9EUPU|nr:unnamed protein product [Candidula unifasciata]